MNILLVSLDQAKLYPPKIQDYIQSKGINCYLSKWRKDEIDAVLSTHDLQPNDTIIHARVAGPHVNNTFKSLEERGYRVINKSSTLELTSNKYKSFITARDNHIPCAKTILVKNNAEEVLKVISELKVAVVKPVYSQGLGKYCKKLDEHDSLEKVRTEIFDIPGEEVIVQEFIPYQKLIRTIVIDFKAVPEATTYDEPIDDWKASVCMNPQLKKYEEHDSLLYKLAEDTAKALEAEISFIDIFETPDNQFVLNEINTACGFIIHDDVTGAKIYEHIGEYLVEQAK